jgi:hypothetical protein
MSPSRDSAPARSNTVWKNRLGSLMRHRIVLAATTGVFSTVRNSVEAGAYAYKRASKVRTLR